MENHLSAVTGGQVTYINMEAEPQHVLNQNKSDYASWWVLSLAAIDFTKKSM